MGRILYVNQASEVSGAERSLVELALGVAGAGHHEVAIAAPEGAFARFVRDHDVAFRPIPATDLSFRLDLRHTPAGLAWIPRTALLLRRMARREGFTILHGNATRAALLVALAGLGSPRLKTVSHIRDGVPPGSVGKAVLGLASLSDASIANSGWVAGQFPRGGRGVEVIHNSVDLTRFDPGAADPGPVRRELGLEDGPVIALIGHFIPTKAQDDAVRMLAQVRESHPTAKLLLVGSAKFTGPGTRFDSAGFRASVERLAAELGLSEEAVVFAGERTDVPELLAASDVLIVPSLEEPFGRVVVEGMAMGLPVVATSVGGPPEIIENRSEGRILPPARPELWGQCLAELLSDPELMANYGAAARQRVASRFTPERTVEAVLEVYRSLGG